MVINRNVFSVVIPFDAVVRTYNMSQLLCQNFGYLHHLTSCSPHQRTFLLATASPEQVHAICEVCSNLAKGTIPLTQVQKERLKKHADDIRELADPYTPFKTKKQILSQRGGGFVSDVMYSLKTALKPFFL